MHLHELLLAAVVLLSVTAAAVLLFKRLGLGSVIGFLAAGVLVGPSGLVITDADRVEEIRHIAELGVVLLLFVIGLEMQPRKLWSMRASVFGLGTAQIVLTGLVITGYGMLFDLSWQAALVAGFGLALSSTAFVLQLLAERGEMAAPHGKTGFSILLMQDIAIVPLLALVPLLAEAPPQMAEEPLWERALVVVGLVLAVVAVGRYAIPFALAQAAKRRNMEAFVMLAMLAALVAAWAMDLAGVSMALGAFIMGIMLSASAYRHQVEAAVAPFKGLLIGLFFISVGMSIDVELLFADVGRVLGHTASLIALKVAVLLLIGLAVGLGRSTAVRASFLLAQCGEFGFVLFGAATVAGVLTDTEFAFLLLVVSLTMLVTPLVAKLGALIAERLEPRAAEPVAEGPAEAMDKHVVVAGYGRFGRIVCIMLERMGIPYAAYDTDAERIDVGKREGHHVYFGNMADPRVVDTARLGTAASLVVTLNDVHASERLIDNVRGLYPDLPIHARARDLSCRDSLLAHGVHQAIPEAAEAGLRLGAAVLARVGMPEDDLGALVDDLRREDYGLLRVGGRTIDSPDLQEATAKGV